MKARILCCIASVLLPASGLAEGPAKAAPDGEKVMSGMSIVGNDEAPKSLVIVPWKSSELGDGLAVPLSLDDARQPLDREVFMRQLAYYEIRTGAPDSSKPEIRQRIQNEIKQHQGGTR